MSLYAKVMGMLPATRMEFVVVFFEGNGTEKSASSLLVFLFLAFF